VMDCANRVDVSGVVLFYDPSRTVGATSPASPFGRTWTLNANGTLNASIAFRSPGMYYVYARVTTPSGVAGPFIRTITPVSVRAFMAPESIGLLTTELVQAYASTIRMRALRSDPTVPSVTRVFYDSSGTTTTPRWSVGTATMDASGWVALDGAIPTVGSVFLFTSTSSNSPTGLLPTPTWYYPLVSDLRNYANGGGGVADATMGVAGSNVGGVASFSTVSPIGGGSLTFAGGVRNAAGVSYVVLPLTSSGSTAAFTCWFRSNNNSGGARIIDLAGNGSFRVYIAGSNSLSVNDVHTISTSTSLNNNTWNFLALNTSGSTLSWSVNAGDAGNSGTGALSKVVDVANSVGYLGHSFGADPEFSGAMCDVRFYANANLSTSEIRALYYYGLQSAPTRPRSRRRRLP